MKRIKFELNLPTIIFQAIERYRDSLVPRPSRTFVIAQACIEYLAKRGYKVSAKDQVD